MKTAIVYYSMSGNTEFVAQEIAKKIDADVLQIYPVKAYPDQGARKYIWGGKSAVLAEKPKLLPYMFHAEEYDRIIFGTPVWASNFVPPIRTFIHENAEELKGKHFAAYICYGGGGGTKAMDKLKKCLGIEEFDAELILIEPKDQPNEENNDKISEFCSRL